MELATLDEKGLRAFAFELWALKCNRRMSKVRQELAKEEQDIPLATLNQWAKEEEWAIRAKEMMDYLEPDIAHRTWSTVTLATNEAAEYLREVINGNFFPELEPEEIENLPYDPAPLARIRVEAAKQMMFMNGWNPNAPGLTNGKPKGDGGQQLKKRPQDMTMEELELAAQELLDRTIDEKQQQIQAAKKGRIR